MIKNYYTKIMNSISLNNSTQFQNTFTDFLILSFFKILLLLKMILKNNYKNKILNRIL